MILIQNWGILKQTKHREIRDTCCVLAYSSDETPSLHFLPSSLSHIGRGRNERGVQPLMNLPKILLAEAILI